MAYPEKNKAQLIDELRRLQQRVQELEASLNIYQEECIQKVDYIEASHEYLQSIIDNIADPVLVIDRDYRIILANRKTREIAGGGASVKAGLFCHQVSHHRETPCTGRNEPCPLKKILKTKSPVVVTHTHFDSKGNKILVEINASPVLDKDGEVVHMIEMCRDITERRKMEEALRESETRYRSLFEQSKDAIFIIQAEGPEVGKILSANQSACLMHGYTQKEILCMSIFNLNTPEYVEKAPKLIKRMLAGEALRFEVMHTRKDGTIFPVEVSASVIEIGNKKLILAIDRDISRRKQTEEERYKLIKELERISQIDGLTDLLNRQYLDKRLSQEISRAKRYGNDLSLMMFDIDNFKEINDKYGHIIGDKILQKIASVLKETLRDTDIAGRFGGDEFIIILVQTDLNVGLQVAQRIHAQIEKAKIPFKKRRYIGFTVSMGVCQYNNKIESLEDFITKVDEALYRAKQSGHNKICEAKD